MSSDDQQPRNRRERRAAAKEAGKQSKPRSQSQSQSTHLNHRVPGIPYAQPSRTPNPHHPPTKTLYQLAEERAAELAQTRQPTAPPPYPQTTADAEREEEEKDAAELIGPLGDALIYAFTLSTLHLTLDVLVYNQYRQAIIWGEILGRLRTVFPLLLLSVYLVHTRTARRRRYLRRVQQVVFAGAATAAGCFLVRAGNTAAYYAVMKRAPPVGTFWVWCVLEMELGWAVGSVAAVAAYTWWNGYAAF